MNQKEKTNVIENFEKGRNNYIFKRTASITLVFLSVMLLCKLIFGDVVTIKSGPSFQLLFNGNFLIEFIVYLFIIPILMFFYARSEWLGIETAYSEINKELKIK